MEEVPLTMIDLGGRRVLVTGAAERLGAVIARAFAESGAEVIVHCFRSTDAADTLLKTLPSGAPFIRHSRVSCDLADLDAVRSLPGSVGPVDILVNNAAMWIRGNTPQAELERQETVNHLAPCELIRGFAAIRPDGREFSAVNILDAAVLLPGFVPATPYETAKASLMRDTLELALELAPHIRVNGVAPGPVFAPRELGSEGMKRTPAELPLKRAVVPEDVARAVIFLASSSSVTGAILPVDCGQSLRFSPPT